jgi:hypothetical protein
MLNCGLRPYWWTAEAQGFAGCKRGWHKRWWALQMVRSHQGEDRVVLVDHKGVARSNCAIPSFPSTPIISGFWAVLLVQRIMSRYGVLARLPWDDDQEDDDEMNLFKSGGGDSKMSSPSTPKAVSGPPTSPPSQ